MKRMLFNATHQEELRVAIVDGQKLIDLDIEYAGREQRKGNIYKAVITRIEPALEAAFVDYGTDRHGFLPFKEIARSYLQGEDGEFSRARIASLLKEKQEIIVQVDKDERGNKGAALTSFISLAGRYLVLMPNNPRGGGVSRRVEGEERSELRDVLAQLNVPQGMSLIARTAGIGRTVEELQWDLNYLLQLWQAIEGASGSQDGAFLIYQEGSLVIRAIRDLFQPDIGEILIDTETIYEQARQFMSHVMPGNVNKVKFYRDDVPLFSRFQIEHQIETAYRREVSLPSGGAIVIDHTEALVSVDVNSARATRGADIEATAVNTNLEAADEIARQLRLRDLGGLIVIDFIDMENPRNQREVENRLRDALHFDRARVQTGKISRFGLLELSRQRLQPSLGETSHTPCPRCHGTGFIRDTESSALHILRILQEEAMKENTAIVRAQVPVDVATFLLNEKRADIYALEARLRVNILMIPNEHLETPNYNVVRIRHDEANQEGTPDPSYRLVEQPAEEEPASHGHAEPKGQRQLAAVRGVTPPQPAPVTPVAASSAAEPPAPLPAPVAVASAPAAAAAPASGGTFIGRIISWFKGGEPARAGQSAAVASTPAKEEKPAGARGGERQRRERGGERQERGGRRERGEREDRNERGERPEGRRSTEARAPREGGDGRRSANGDARSEDRSSDKRSAEARGGEERARDAGEAPEGGSRRRGRGDRSRRGEGVPAAAAPEQQEMALATPVAEGAAVLEAAPAAEGERNGEGRSRRGRRGGRGRGNRDGSRSGEAQVGDNGLPAGDEEGDAAQPSEIRAQSHGEAELAAATVIGDAAVAAVTLPQHHAAEDAPAASHDSDGATAQPPAWQTPGQWEAAPRASEPQVQAEAVVATVQPEAALPVFVHAQPEATAQPVFAPVQAEAVQTASPAVIDELPAAPVATAPEAVSERPSALVEAAVAAMESAPVKVEAPAPAVEAELPAAAMDGLHVTQDVAPWHTPAAAAPVTAVEPVALPMESNLVLVETRHAAPLEEPVAAAQPRRRRVVRERPTAGSSVQEPLMQVETQTPPANPES